MPEAEVDPEPTFNLVSEPWIPVLMCSGERRDLSLIEVLRDAHEVEALACDLPTQDFALLRLLLAILRRSLDWEPSVARGSQPALIEEWAGMWRAGRLPKAPVEYLEEWRDRFWLLGGERPFYQVADLAYVKANRDAGSLDALIADVPAGHRYFTQRRLPSWEWLAPAEAALWLIHSQSFDASGIRSGVLGDPSVKAGKSYPIGTAWCGGIGGQFLTSTDLSRTLLLNLPLGSERDQDSAEDLPAWECSAPPMPPATGGREPTGPIDLLTWQSRRLRLAHDAGRVTGVVLTNGDRCRQQNRMGLEFMTAWRRSENQEKKLGIAPVYMPRAHVAQRSAWRGLAALLADPSDQANVAASRPAGVISWLDHLRGLGHVDRFDDVAMVTVGMAYGANDSTFLDLIGDRLDFAVQILEPEHRHHAVAAAEDADSAATAVAILARNLHLASGGDAQGAPMAAAREQAFARLDEPFRAWLRELGHIREAPENFRGTWQRTVKDQLLDLCSDWMRDAPPAAWIGRKEGARWVSAPDAELRFRAALGKALPLTRKQKEAANDGDR